MKNSHKNNNKNDKKKLTHRRRERVKNRGRGWVKTSKQVRSIWMMEKNLSSRYLSSNNIHLTGDTERASEQASKKTSVFSWVCVSACKPIDKLCTVHFLNWFNLPLVNISYKWSGGKMCIHANEKNMRSRISCSVCRDVRRWKGVLERLSMRPCVCVCNNPLHQFNKASAICICI